MTSQHHRDQNVPREVLIAAGALILVTIGIAGGARLARSASPEDVAPPVTMIELSFADMPDGSVAVMAGSTSRILTEIPPESNGFMRGVLRGMFRTRKLESVGRDAPFQLARHADGRLTLSDPETGRTVELRSFGATNRDSFERLLALGDRRASR